MDLTKFNLSRSQVNKASQVLNYQPFIIKDNIQTGVAYSWLYDGGRKDYQPQDFVWIKEDKPADKWEKFVEAN